MIGVWTLARYASVVAVFSGCGWLGWTFIDLAVWVEASNGLFIVLSVFAAAVFIRLARPSPFSNPDVFTTENFDRYFDALTIVARRLSVVLVAVGLSVALLVCAVLLASPPPLGPPQVGQAVSASLSGLLAFLVMRFVSVVRGDIGFIQLQREITQDARKRSASETAASVASQPPTWKSGGDYGRAVNS